MLRSCPEDWFQKDHPGNARIHLDLKIPGVHWRLYLIVQTNQFKGRQANNEHSKATCSVLGSFLKINEKNEY